jgi:2-oxoisovalerate dehydrogenase E1 component
MLREAVRLAREEQRVVVFIEPIALYPMRDLHNAGDAGWLRAYPQVGEDIALGEIGVTGDGRDLAIVSYANGHYLSVQAAAKLKAQGINVRNIDLRWLAPMPKAAVLDAVKDCGSVLIVDECRRTGSQSEGLMAMFAENTQVNLARVTAHDSFIATGPAYGATLPSTQQIVDAALKLVKSA